MITIDHVTCDVCGTCVGVCPADALVIEFDTLVCRGEVCIDCGACVRICPLVALGGGDD